MCLLCNNINTFTSYSYTVHKQTYTHARAGTHTTSTSDRGYHKDIYTVGRCMRSLRMPPNIPNNWHYRFGCCKLLEQHGTNTHARTHTHVHTADRPCWKMYTPFGTTIGWCGSVVEGEKTSSVCCVYPFIIIASFYVGVRTSVWWPELLEMTAGPNHYCSG